MAAPDIDRLLEPISDEAESGDNLEYDAAFQELERIAVGKAGTYDPVSGETVGAEEPNWQQVRDQSVELFNRTQDLRVAYYLTVALLRLDGFPGFAAGLNLISGMLERYWSSLHPDLVEDEDNDPIERLNVLANLIDPERFLPIFRSTPIVAAPAVGRFNLRDLDIAQARAEPREGEQAATLSLLGGAWQEAGPDENSARQAAVQAALAALAGIKSTFDEQAGTTPDFDELIRQLRSVKAFYDEMSGGEVDEDAAGDGEAGGMAAVASGAQGVGGGLASRGDASRLLRQVSDFLRRTEPSSPARMFIDRAVKLLDMDFADIVLELMPDSRERIELMGGIKFSGAGDDDD